MPAVSSSPGSPPTKSTSSGSPSKGKDAKMIFNENKDKNGFVPIQKLNKALPILDTLIKSDAIDQSTVDILILETGANAAKGLNEKQFLEFHRMMEEYNVALDDVNDDAFGSTQSINQNDNDDDLLIEDFTNENDDNDAMLSSDDLSDEDIEKLLKSIFDEIKNKKTNKVSITKVLDMETIKNAIENEELTENMIMNTLQTMNLKLSQDIDFPTFSALLDSLEKNITDDDEEEEEDEIDRFVAKTKASSNSNKDGDDEDYENDEDEEEDDLSEDEKLQMMKEVYNELKSPKSDKMTVKQFKSWENIQQALDNNYLTTTGLDEILTQVTKDSVGTVKNTGFGKKPDNSIGSRELDFDQFVTVLDYVEEALNFDNVKDEELIIPSKPTSATTSTTTNINAEQVSRGLDNKPPVEDENRMKVDTSAVANQWSNSNSKTSAAAVSPSGGKGFGKQPTIEELTKTGKKQRPLTPDQIAANAVAKEIYDDLRGIVS